MIVPQLPRHSRRWPRRVSSKQRILWSLLGTATVALGIALQRLGPAAGKIAAALPSTAVVSRVIDGDTVELADGRRLRYLGINTPELRRRAGTQWVYHPEPFGEEAAAANQQLVAGKTVRLEYDARPYDKYSRLLAYVYVGKRSVNAELLARGLARVLIIPPNVRHAEEFEALQRQARQQRAGLWGR